MTSASPIGIAAFRPYVDQNCSIEWTFGEAAEHVFAFTQSLVRLETLLREAACFSFMARMIAIGRRERLAFQDAVGSTLLDAIHGNLFAQHSL